MYKLLICSLLLLGSLSCHAKQRVTVLPDEAGSGIVSTKAYTRIYVKGEHIIDVKGVVDRYALNFDRLLGQLYLIAIPTKNKSPFSLFLTTDSYHVYQLNLTANGKLADSIEINPKKRRVVKRKIRRQMPPSTPKELIGALVHNLPLKTFAKLKARERLKVGHNRALSFQLTQNYKGKRLTAKVITVTNKGHRIYQLKKRWFDDKKLAALAFERMQIKPNETLKIWVVSHA